MVLNVSTILPTFLGTDDIVFANQLPLPIQDINNGRQSQTTNPARPLHGP